MKKILFVTFMLLLLTPGYAQLKFKEDGKINIGTTAQADYEYTPLVREGVEWGYFESDIFPQQNFNPHRLQFKGEAVINGITYKKLYSYTACSIDDQGCTLKAYMREEAGKIYLYVTKECDLYEGLEARFIGSHLEVSLDNEILVYDFTPNKVGDKVLLFGCDERTVEEFEYVEVKGSLRKKLRLTNVDIAIEGLGMINTGGGDMPFPYFPIPTSGYYSSCLNYIRQIGGDYLYTSPDFNVYFVDPCLASVDGVSKDGLHITQSKDAITVEMPASEGASTVELVDIAGRVMQRSVAESGTAFTIITTELPKGAYIVIVSSTSGRYTQKVIIK